MKIYKTNEEVESIVINCSNGQAFSIWLPHHVDMKIGTLEYDEDNPDDIHCEINISCEALFKNINVVED